MPMASLLEGLQPLSFDFVDLCTSILTSNTTGGVPCPGDVITFTCTQDPPDSILRWRILRSGSAVALVEFIFPRDQPPAEQTLTSNEVSGTAAVISYSPNTTVVSTLTITVTRQQEGNVVECAGTTPGSIQNTVINIASMGYHSKHCALY